jgi:hypothetical protein
MAVDLPGRGYGAKQPADEQSTQQRHAERLDPPVDPDRDRDAAPLPGEATQRGEIDHQQHRTIISQISTAIGMMTSAIVILPSTWNGVAPMCAR